MSSILDPDFLEISELKMENQRLRDQLIDEQNKHNGLSDVVCKWIEVYGEKYIQIPSSPVAKGPYISGALCTDLRSLIDSIIHGDISVAQAYMGLTMAGKIIAEA